MQLLVFAFFLTRTCWCVQVHPLYPYAIQPSWQASVPVPINVNYDVPNYAQFQDETQALMGNENPGLTGFASANRLENTSFALSPDRLIAQAILPEQFNIRLHEPVESIQQSLDGVEAVESVWEQDRHDSQQRYAASKQQLFDAIGLNIGPYLQLLHVILGMILFLLILTANGEPLLSEEVKEQLTAQLSDTCGTACTSLLDDIFPLLTKNSDVGHEFSLFNQFLGKIVANGKSTNEKVLAELHGLSSFAETPVVTANSTNATISPHDVLASQNVSILLPPVQPGFPCRTQAECDALDFKINRCATLRQEVLKAYVGSNAALDVMASLLSVLCGCIFVGPVKFCALQGIPYTCGFPFMAYEGIYGVSMSLWGAVRAMTTSRMKYFFSWLLLDLVYGSALLGRLKMSLLGKSPRPVKYEDTQPRLEIRLSAPRHPLPQVSDKIEVLDKARRVTEEREMGKLIKSFDEELNRSRRLIVTLIRKALEAFDDPVVIPKRSSSFYELPWSHIHEGKVWISVEGAPPIDGSVLKRLETIEERNAKEEIELFKGAVDDMHEVTRFTLQKLNETLVNTLRPVINTGGDRNLMYSSFLAFAAGDQRCREIQEQFGASSITCGENKGEGPHAHIISNFAASEHTYPTVESLLRDMLDRREIDEELFQERSLNLMARLAQEQSKIIAETLEAAVTTIKIQYNDVIQATNLTKQDFQVYNRLHPKINR